MTDAFTISTTFQQRDQWSRKVARDRCLKQSHRNVLQALALCARINGDGKLVIDPTYVEIANAAGCSERTAYRVIINAEESGIIRKARHSDGRVSNSYELVLQAVNGSKKAGKAPEKTQEIQCPTLPKMVPSKGSNPATAVRVLKAKRKEVVRKQEQEEGAEGTASFLLTRESNAANGVTGPTLNNVEIVVLVAEPAADAPMSPALSADHAAALHDPKPTRETADAARWLQQFMDDIRRKQNPVVKDLLNASYFQNEGRAAKPRGARKIYESHYEAAYGPEP
jgi:hypothetical protein